MSGLNVLVVTSYGDHTALTGGRLRRDNIVTELRLRGAHVDRIDVPARPGIRSAVRAAGLSRTADLRKRARRRDVVLLGDVFCLPMMPCLRRLHVPVVLDLVDSPYRLVASAPRTSARARAAATAQAWQLVPVMQWAPDGGGGGLHLERGRRVGCGAGVPLSGIGRRPERDPCLVGPGRSGAAPTGRLRRLAGGLDLRAEPRIAAVVRRRGRARAAGRHPRPHPAVRSRKSLAFAEGGRSLQSRQVATCVTRGSSRISAGGVPIGANRPWHPWCEAPE